ncbi:hypothetical protein VTH06DRAFT_5422 [Thermothelomyces fergusii]
MDKVRPQRPANRAGFEIAVYCALPLEADAVDALLDHCWDDDDTAPPYNKAYGDPNAYTLGVLGRHNVVLIHGPDMGKVHAAMAAVNCKRSFPNIRLLLLVGICGAVPFYGPDGNHAEIVLGDVVVSDGVVQYDLGRKFPERFVRKDGILDVLGRPSLEVRTMLAKLKDLSKRGVLREEMERYMKDLEGDPELGARYPGADQDRLFEATYNHKDERMLCDECGCDGRLVPRKRLAGGDASPRPVVHFGLIASGDTVMRSGVDRDTIARDEGIIAFEMEGAGAWDTIPCVVIKGACDYADSHKNKAWQRYAAATAAACMKSFVVRCVPFPLSSLDPFSNVRKRLTARWCLADRLKEDFEMDEKDSKGSRAVAETWVLSFEQIEKQNPFAGELHSLVSLFDRRAIPPEFLSWYISQHHAEKSDHERAKALDLLKAYCLIVEDTGQRYNVHRLVQLVTRKWLERRKTKSKFARFALLAVYETIRNCVLNGHGDRARYSGYLLHAVAVLGFDFRVPVKNA